MPIPAYMTVTDDTGKKIDGSVTVEGREGTCEILEFDHEVRMPIDSDDGNITGTRKHEPFVFTKSQDAASPYMYKAVANGQTLKNMTLVWYKIDDTGSEKEYFRHTLEDVKITSIKPKMYNTKDLDKERYPHLETVSCKYGKITWTYADGNIEFSDSWVESR
jgi:type VI secretion system secreted protein Hcp